MRQKRRVVALVAAWVLVSVLGGTVPAAAADDSVGASVMREITSVLEEYVARIKRKDAVGIAEMYSYPYKTVHPDGEVKIFATKEELISFLEAEQAGIEGFEAIEVDVRELSHSGNTAIAKAATFVTVILEGQPTTYISEVEFRFLRSGERWLISEEWTLGMDVSAGE